MTNETALKGCYVVHALKGNGLVCSKCFNNSKPKLSGTFIPLMVRKQVIKQRERSDFYYNDKCCICKVTIV